MEVQSASQKAKASNGVLKHSAVSLGRGIKVKDKDRMAKARAAKAAKARAKAVKAKTKAVDRKPRAETERAVLAALARGGKTKIELMKGLKVSSSWLSAILQGLARSGQISRKATRGEGGRIYSRTTKASKAAAVSRTSSRPVGQAARAGGAGRSVGHRAQLEELLAVTRRIGEIRAELAQAEARYEELFAALTH